MPFVDFPDNSTANEKVQIIHEAINIYDFFLATFKQDELIEITRSQSEMLYRLNLGTISFNTCRNHALTMSDFVMSNQRINYIQDLIASSNFDPAMAEEALNLFINR